MTVRTITFLSKRYMEANPSGFVPGLADAISVADMTGAQLITLYNLVSSNLGRGSVKRFADSKSGAKRTWKLLCDWADQGDFEMSEEELAQQKGRDEIKREDIANPAVVIVEKGPEASVIPSLKVVKTVDGGTAIVTNKPKVELSDADKAQIADEAKSRKPDPVEALMTVATTGAARTQLRNNPPASNNPAKDAEMPALRKAAKALNLEPKNKVYARKEGSKQAILVDLLSRPEGATFGELYDALAATGKPWKGVTIRSGLAWDINHIAGYGVKSELFNGLEFVAQGRDYEAARLGIVGDERGHFDVPGPGYDPDLKLAVYRLAYPDGMEAPLPHLPGSKKA